MMMISKKTFYSLGLAAALAALTLLFLFHFSQEQNSCAGVRILSEKEYHALKGPVDTDTAQYLMQNGQPAAMDVQTDTLYVSINPGSDWRPQNFSAALSSSHPEHKLYFAPDKAFEDMKTAVSQNHIFTLLLVHNNQYTPYSVSFTTLPVLEMSAPYQEDRDALRRGDIVLWDPYSSGNAYYSISISEAEWHTRGGASKGSFKQPYKISLKKQGSAENRSLSLLGMDKDDDWILNSLVFDDIKIREKTISSVWNAIQDNRGSDLKMSEGEYVEVLLDGRYSGLYMLQRRVDNKFLGSGRENDVILEGSKPHHPVSVSEAYPIKHNPSVVPESEIYEAMTPYYLAMSSSEDFRNFPNLNMDTWIDVNLFSSAFILEDNCAYKNMFYVLHKQDDRYALDLIPWDVDMSFGMKWDDATQYFAYDVNAMHQPIPWLRRETASFFKLDPSLKNRMALRWKELREGLLSTEHLKSVIHSYRTVLSESGALIRDEVRRSLYHGGKDTMESLLQNFPGHLSNMDAYYQNLLEGNSSDKAEYLIKQ